MPTAWTPRSIRPATAAGDVLPETLVVSAPAFVGRETEAAALEKALTGSPATVLVEGEAGIGKTRLLAEVLARPSVRGRRTMVSACPPLRQPCTLGPVVDALRHFTGGVTGLGLSALAGALRPLFPEWSADLPPVPEPLDDATAVRHRLFSALGELLSGLKVDVLVVEDVHWADEATVEFLLFLRAQRIRPGIVVTCRPEDLPDDSLVRRLSSRLAAGDAGLRLALRPLGLAETASLASSMLCDGVISRALAAFLHERTDGLPLAIEELTRLMHDQFGLTAQGGQWFWPGSHETIVPGTIRDGVLERCRGLSPGARAALDAAAVLADPAAEQTLHEVAGLAAGQTGAALTELLRRGLLTEDEHDDMTFRHVLVAQAVYEAISPPRRRDLHLRAGEALEHRARPPLTQLIRHFRQAGDTARWCRYAEQAADLALAAGDETTAGAVLYDVLVNAELPAGPVVRLIKKMPFGSLADHESVRDLARSLRTVLDVGVVDRADEAAARLLLGRVLLMVGDRAAARAELERAIRDPGCDSAEAARAAILLGWPFHDDWPAAEHRRWLDRAASVTTSMSPADRLNLVVERACGLLMLGEADGWTVAAQISGDPASAVERQLLVKAHLNIGDVAMAFWGRDEEGRRWLTQGLELAKAHDYRLYLDAILALLVHLDWLSGAWDGLARRAAALAGRPGLHPFSRLKVDLVRGALHAAAGNFGQAVRDMELALGEARRLGVVDAVIESAAALARLRLADGRAGEALRITGEPVTLIARKGIWVWATDVLPVHVEALVAADAVERADQVTKEFAVGLDGRDAPAPQAALLLCQALVAAGRGGHAQAGILFAQAAKAWGALPRPYPALLARERQARCLLAAGRQDSALAILGEVRQGLAALGARRDALRVTATLNEHGVQAERPGSGGRRRYDGQLSPREVDVVRLVVGGRTNRQIADALFLSPKTVACHVYSAMRKLSVSNRAGLAARALETGLGPGAETVAKPGQQGPGRAIRVAN